jgi:hypothetical protein
MPYTAEVVVYPTGRSQKEMAYRAYVRVSPDGGDAEIIAGNFGRTQQEAIASALSSLKQVIIAATPLLRESP